MRNKDIPTTEDIRSLITDGGFWPSTEFDLWLATHDAEIKQLAEARIIVLLEDNFSRFDLSNNQVDGIGLDEFKALIAGENK